MTLINNIKLINFLSKYTYSQIYAELQSSITQVNANYLSEQAKLDLLLHNISARLESFARDLQNFENQNKVVKTYNYFWGSNKENAELSATGLGFSQGLNTKLPLFVPRVLIPSIYNKVNSESVKNAFEVTLGMIHSSVTGDVLTLTNDQPFVHNAPKKQIVCDSVRETNSLFVLEDFKIMPLYKYLLLKYPMIAFNDEQAQRNVATNALMRVNIQASSININDLNNSLISGVHTREILGAYSNKFPVEE